MTNFAYLNIWTSKDNQNLGKLAVIADEWLYVGDYLLVYRKGSTYVKLGHLLRGNTRETG